MWLVGNELKEHIIVEKKVKRNSTLGRIIWKTVRLGQVVELIKIHLYFQRLNYLINHFVFIYISTFFVSQSYSLYPSKNRYHYDIYADKFNMYVEYIETKNQDIYFLLLSIPSSKLPKVFNKMLKQTRNILTKLVCFLIHYTEMQYSLSLNLYVMMHKKFTFQTNH